MSVLFQMNLLMSACSIWWLLLGCMLFGFFLGSIVMYLCTSHRILVSKSCGGGCRRLVRCGRLLWEYRLWHCVFRICFLAGRVL